MLLCSVGEYNHRKGCLAILEVEWGMQVDLANWQLDEALGSLLLTQIGVFALICVFAILYLYLYLCICDVG